MIMEAGSVSSHRTARDEDADVQQVPTTSPGVQRRSPRSRTGSAGNTLNTATGASSAQESQKSIGQVIDVSATNNVSRSPWEQVHVGQIYRVLDRAASTAAVPVYHLAVVVAVYSNRLLYLPILGSSALAHSDVAYQLKIAIAEHSQAGKGSIAKKSSHRPPPINTGVHHSEVLHAEFSQHEDGSSKSADLPLEGAHVQLNYVLPHEYGPQFTIQQDSALVGRLLLPSQKLLRRRYGFVHSQHFAQSDPVEQDKKMRQYITGVPIELSDRYAPDQKSPLFTTAFSSPDSDTTASPPKKASSRKPAKSRVQNVRATAAVDAGLSDTMSNASSSTSARKWRWPTNDPSCVREESFDLRAGFTSPSRYGFLRCAEIEFDGRTQLRFECSCSGHPEDANNTPHNKQICAHKCCKHGTQEFSKANVDVAHIDANFLASHGTKFVKCDRNFVEQKSGRGTKARNAQASGNLLSRVASNSEATRNDLEDDATAIFEGKIAEDAQDRLESDHMDVDDGVDPLIPEGPSTGSPGGSGSPINDKDKGKAKATSPSKKRKQRQDDDDDGEDIVKKASKTSLGATATGSRAVVSSPRASESPNENNRAPYARRSPRRSQDQHEDAEMVDADDNTEEVAATTDVDTRQSVTFDRPAPMENTWTEGQYYRPRDD